MTSETCYITMSSMSGEVNDADIEIGFLFNKVKTMLKTKFNMVFEKDPDSSYHDIIAVCTEKRYDPLYEKCGSKCSKSLEYPAKLRLTFQNDNLSLFTHIPTCNGYQSENILKEICLLIKETFGKSSYWLVTSQPTIFSKGYRHPKLSLHQIRDTETFIRRVKV